jgi:hypothetical protein
LSRTLDAFAILRALDADFDTEINDSDDAGGKSKSLRHESKAMKRQTTTWMQ